LAMQCSEDAAALDAAEGKDPARTFSTTALSKSGQAKREH
jgi:hypothetical protein